MAKVNNNFFLVRKIKPQKYVFELGNSFIKGRAVRPAITCKQRRLIKIKCL